MPVGDVMVVSHSGSMIGALVSRGRARGVGFASLVSVGNEVDLSVGEIGAATLDDPQIKGYVLFLESLHHGQALRAFALAAAERGKPVVVYKLGRSSVAADMVQSHTGALAGEDDIADAFFKDSGMARVGILESLLEAQALAVRWPLLGTGQPLRRVGVVTTTGGGAAMLVDQLGIRGVVVEAASAETLQRLNALGVSVNPGRVLDLTLAGTRYEVMKAALDVMLAAPEFDAVVAVVGSSARFQPQLAVQPIIDSATHTKPLAAMIVPDAPQAIAQLTAAQVPCFRTPECCADVIAALVSRRAHPVQAALAARIGSGGRAPKRPDQRQPIGTRHLVGAPVARLAGPVGVDIGHRGGGLGRWASALAPAVCLPRGGQGLLGPIGAQKRARWCGLGRGRCPGLATGDGAGENQCRPTRPLAVGL
jgi:acyl-CoA synthetase (NDP forming)